MSPDLAEPFTARSDPADRQRPAAAMPAIDWRAFRKAGRACAARPSLSGRGHAPPAPGRDHATGLLLCGRHYRASREALTAAGADVFDGAGRTVIPPAKALLDAR